VAANDRIDFTVDGDTEVHLSSLAAAVVNLDPSAKGLSANGTQ